MTKLPLLSIRKTNNCTGESKLTRELHSGGYAAHKTRTIVLCLPDPEDTEQKIPGSDDHRGRFSREEARSWPDPEVRVKPEPRTR